MNVVERIYELVNLGPEFADFRRDTITLAWEDRRQGHGRRRSDQGLDFAISLPGGTTLKEGDCIVLESEQVVVQVREANEAVYVITPGTPQQWAFYAYQVGNRHQPLMIDKSELLVPQGPAVRSLLDQLNVPYAEAVRPFTATVAAAGHSH